jgi:hypothetical protein
VQSFETAFYKAATLSTGMSNFLSAEKIKTEKGKAATWSTDMSNFLSAEKINTEKIRLLHDPQTY